MTVTQSGTASNVKDAVTPANNKTQLDVVDWSKTWNVVATKLATNDWEAGIWTYWFTRIK